MRLIPLLALLLAACSNEPKVPSLPAGHFAGAGRDALCISGTGAQQRGGFITYGDGDNNCSARGRIENVGSAWTLVPNGEGDCRIPLTVNEKGIQLGTAQPRCDYYCGPGASFAAKVFRRSDPAVAPGATADLAGDPLC
jgi:hypothetical protein